MPTLPDSHRFSSLSTAVALAFALVWALAFAALPARADCIDDAAARHQVNADVLRAIGWQESRLQPAALRHNDNGSVDVGAFQINSIHLPELARYGIARAALTDGCVCAEVAAWHYRRQVDLQGDGWQAVGAYHSRTAGRAAWYANQIAAILMRWKVMPPGPLPFPAEHTLAPGRAPLSLSKSLSPISPPNSPPIWSPPAAMPSPLATATPTTTPIAGGYGELAYLPSAR